MKTPLAILFLLILHPFAHAQETDSVRLQTLYRQCHSDFARGDYLSALKHRYQYQALKTSMLNVIKQQQLVQLQNQYQTAKKDLEIRLQEKNIKLLSAQNNLMDINLNKTRLMRTIVIVVGISAALLLAASFWQYKHKIAANRHLQDQQQAINQQNYHLEELALLKDDLLGEKELLIKEIHHRVKNNLQVVISLLNTQSFYLNDARAVATIRQSQHRMQSISLIHQKLYQSESRALINIREYTHELVQYLRQSFDTGNQINFQIDIAEIDMDVLRVVPLGLILNEAITNALQYAFTQGQQGDITVELTCQGTEHLSLMVSDNGCGLPPGFDLEACESLGINLIKNMCREIDGVLAIDQQCGVTIMVDFKAVNGGISSFDDSLKAIVA